ncbi:hypothetical protein IQ274_23270 [Nostoc sp. LEGE 12447]|uniref:hypothetical protein n=1 Tax=Nostoc sp. LEGE 12447 TaxID=1828640 RepID=UPI001883B829|nr:hypothetical protein [Nostoc sp. LEGE 12447]MBE9001062.1 hypothetical protein [Nostoc sp. LEGE 12447]
MLLSFASLEFLYMNDSGRNGTLVKLKPPCWQGVGGVGGRGRSLTPHTPHTQKSC